MRRRNIVMFTIVGTVGLFACGGSSSRADGAAISSVGVEAEGQHDPASDSRSIRHVIYVQFDNVHFTRDIPNVPSDLEQMPHLLSFITGGGTLLDNHHTPLVSHTANDIATSLTGLYPDRQGLAVANAYQVFAPDGSSSSYAPSFTYWTDPVSATDTAYNMVGPDGKNAPAPWVAYTRAGWDVGAAGVVNIELENVDSDVATVFGANSPQAAEAKSNYDQAVADFEGVAVHCAAGSALCGDGSGAVPDVLPDERGGYAGYQALFGHKYVAAKVAPSGISDLNGNALTGFPGFDGMTAAVSLAYVATMQEAGIPVTYAYIADAHDNQSGDNAFGPGEAGYVAQLKAYDAAFAAFFDRLAKDGINRENTLFVFTADEGDHYVGGSPSPANCDGVTTPCTYAQIGELDANLTGLLAGQGVTTSFQLASSLGVYIDGNPAPTDATTRAMERATAAIRVTNPMTSASDSIDSYLADRSEMALLHMKTGDASRFPSFMLFVNPDYYLETSSTACTGTACITQDPGYAWNHGMVSPDVNTTWLGMVGPGVRNDGVSHRVWSDHADVRPTMMALLGLRDDYVHQGRVLVETMRDGDQNAAFLQLAQAYKAINAPVGPLSMASLQISTRSMGSGSSSSDAEYVAASAQIDDITNRRDALAAKMEKSLDDAEFHGIPVPSAAAASMAREAQQLLSEVAALARAL